MDISIQEQQLSRLDSAFSSFLTQRSAIDSTQKPILETLLSKLSYEQAQGHSCIKLNDAEQQLILESGLISENEIAPLKLEHDRLYLYRYWSYENRLAEQIKSLLASKKPSHNSESLINRYFIELIDETDWQREAAIKAINQSFTIITGGPGTGKTTTVVKILALLQELASANQHSLHIALAAPTGKAAMRLQESIGFSKSTLPCSEKIKQHIPETVTTLHRLLGAKHPLLIFNTTLASHSLMISWSLMKLQ